MLDILSDYLNEATSHEMKTNIEEAHDSFERIELARYEDTFTEILMADGNVDLGETLNSIIATTTQFQNQILLEQGVILNPYTSLDILTSIINGLLNIQNYDNPEELSRTADLDGSSEEVFAELMSLVTTVNADELLTHIESVNRFTIVRIKEIANLPTAKELTNEEYLLKIKCMDRFNAFCSFIKSKPQKTTDLLCNGIDIAHSFDIYASVIDRDFESMSEDLAAKELIAMALISSDGVNNPRAIIAKNIEQFISDIDVVTRVTIIVNDLLLRFK